MSGSRVVMMMVAAVVGTAAVAVVGWRAVVSPPPAIQRTAPMEPLPSASSAPPAAEAAVEQAPAVVAETAPLPPPEPAVAAPEPVAAPIQPSFDAVRVEPTGDMVIAGRGAPQSRVVLSEGPRVLTETDSDANGEFVRIPPALRPGDHLLNLRVGSGKLEALANLAVSVPGKLSEKTLATVIEADKPTRVFTDGASAAAPVQGGVVVRSVEAGDEGAFFVSGMGPPAAIVRLYLNEAFVADVRTAADGSWTLRVERGMSPGHYEVRADLVDGGGKVSARAQTPFDYPRQDPVKSTPPASVAVSVPPTPAVPEQPVAAPGVAVVPEIQSLKVVRGDSLWRISRRILGQGQRYTQIYEANSAQIRDPDRIFPGQVLVSPPPQVHN